MILLLMIERLILCWTVRHFSLLGPHYTWPFTLNKRLLPKGTNHVCLKNVHRKRKKFCCFLISLRFYDFNKYYNWFLHKNGSDVSTSRTAANLLSLLCKHLILLHLFNNAVWSYIIYESHHKTMFIKIYKELYNYKVS